MSVAPGTRFGPYEVVAAIGAGGMGEVYKARDTRLERSVAIKVLPAEFAANAQLKTRFEREAKTISQLSHPHICALYDVGENYLVMELLDGETLANRLSRGALSIAETVQMGIQIADALDRAHRAGIIHRDLKPGNIMLTSTGVKLLDFGLAKFADASIAAASDPLTAAATRQQPVTSDGMVVGTLQYMAPEQLEGRETDGRADIFALGAILYEMITGRRAFAGDSRASIIARILGSDPPPLSQTQRLTPPALDRIVKGCLVKHPALRWQCSGDVRRELELLSDESAAEGPPVSRSKTAMLAAVILAVIAAGEGIWLLVHRRPAAAERLVRFTIDPPPNSLIKVANDIGPPAISPDGKSIAFVAADLHSNRHALWVRDLPSVEAKRIELTDGASFPFWSPDGKSIGFFAGGKMKRVDVEGGAPQALADVSFPRGASWGTDGKIVFAPAPFGPLYRISARGGAVEQVTRLDEKAGETSHRWPSFLPDARHVLLLARSAKDDDRRDSIHVADVQTGERKFVTAGTSGATYAQGSLFFVRDRTLFAQPFDLQTMQLRGEAVPVVQKIQVHGSGFSMFAVSQSGVLCYQTGSVMSTLRTVDRHGDVLATFGEPGEYFTPSFDAARRQFVMSMADPITGSLDVWHYDMERSIARRLTFNPADDWCAVLSPDGKRVVFASNRSNSPHLYMKTVDGADEERPVGSIRLAKFPVSWSSDGRFIAYREIGNFTQTDINVLDLKDGTERRFLASPFAETDAAFASSGRWMAYVSDESGRPEVYVTSFPEGSARWQISSGGGSQPRWRGDEKELYYYAADGNITAVPVDTRSGFKAGVPQRLFACELRTSRDDMREYDVAPDGQRFLINTTAGRQPSLPLTVAIGWR